jgi:hypothetical protein
MKWYFTFVMAMARTLHATRVPLLINTQNQIHCFTVHCLLGYLGRLARLGPLLLPFRLY